MQPQDATRDASVRDARSELDVEAVNDRGSRATARDFTLLARGLSGYQGRALDAWVVDSTGYAVMGFASLASLASPDVEVRMPDLLPEGDYHADVFIDANGNGRFDPGEPSWRLSVPTFGSATVTLDATTATSDITTPARVPRSDLVMDLSGFGADEVGQFFALRVIDQSTRATVGAYEQPSLPGPSLTVHLPDIVEEGSNYDLDFWVDADGNGRYEGPPNDHAWRQPVTAGASGVRASWSRSDNYDDLGWR